MTYSLWMLIEFLITHRAELIARCQSQVANRRAPKTIDADFEYGIPLFLNLLIKTLQVEQTSEPMRSREISGPSAGGPVLSEIGVTAKRHGSELLRHGFTLDQVVHDYGDLCQAITDLAFEHDTPILIDEFRTLNRCLDNAIADAVTEFASERDLLLADKGVQSLNERLGFLAHELRNLIQTAKFAVAAIKTGNVGLTGATGSVLDRSLTGLSTLIDSSLADVRVIAGMPARHKLISVAAFVSEVESNASLEARARKCNFNVSLTDPTLAIDVDRDMLFSAVGNLLQNAFKFTHPGTEVSLRVHSVADRVLIEVEDKCGGLPPGDAEKLFLSFTQNCTDKSGLGLGLSICRRSVEANNGVLSVRDVPGTGCVFTIDLPRCALPTELKVAPNKSLH